MFCRVKLQIKGGSSYETSGGLNVHVAELSLLTSEYNLEVRITL